MAHMHNCISIYAANCVKPESRLLAPRGGVPQAKQAQVDAIQKLVVVLLHALRVSGTLGGCLTWARGRGSEQG